jgi:hypothetical protein
MTQTIQELLNNSILSEDVKSEISKVWETKLSEIREQVTAELREEFAERFENDKSQIVEAMDTMLTDVIKSELSEFAEDKKAIQEQRVAYKKAIKEHAKILEDKINESLAKEITELKEDRKAQSTNVKKLEEFVIHQLTEELNEFHTDKKALVEQRIRMVREGKKIIAEAKETFIKNAAAKAEKLIESALRGEIKTLKEDIQTAKENQFGRKIFETFAAEFMTSTLNEGTQVSKLSRQLFKIKEKLSESQKILAQKDKAIMEAKRETKIAKDLSDRKAILNEMLNPLNKDQREIMGSLLESVNTEKLRDTFNKYLPTVLKESNPKISQSKAKLTEGTTVITGDRASRTHFDNEGSAEIIRIKKLAGIS